MADTYTVKWGDTLSEIAYANGTTTKALAQINNISNPDLIYVGQVIKLSSGGVSSSAVKSTSSAAANSSTVTIDHFGLQTKTDRTVFVSWSWSKSHTKEYGVRWWYATENSGVAFIGEDTTTKFKSATYDAPSNAVKVWVHVRPISETYTKNNKETSYWTGSWSSQKTYYFTDNPLGVPSAPSVSIDKYNLTASLDNLDLGERATHIQFEVTKDNATVSATAASQIVTKHASHIFKIDVGSEYKVRCRACCNPSTITLKITSPVTNLRDHTIRYTNFAEYGEWSEYSDNYKTIPNPPGSITACRATSKTSIYLEWAASTTATSYDIEYATKKEYFDGTDSTTTTSNVELTHYEFIGLETGEEYFFRVRAVNSIGTSSWSEIVSTVIGKPPIAPTTWSSTTTVVVGEQLIFYWNHNAEDGSSQTYAELELDIDGTVETKTIQNTTDEDEKDKTSSYTLDTTSLLEGAVIKWRVRTAGVTKEYGNWSVQRTVDVYAPPTLELKVTDTDGNSIETLSSFPFYVSALAGPKTQAPIWYYLTVTANQAYETIDQIGNVKMVSVGDAVYKKYFDTSDALLVELSASNIDLENNNAYNVSCVVSMNSGLTAEAFAPISVDWNEQKYDPNAEVSIDHDTLVAHIRPYCVAYLPVYYKVTYNSITGIYTKTDTVLDELEGTSIDGAFTESGEMVFSATTSSGTVYFCVGYSEEGTPVEDVTLAVYRREFDGTFTEIASDIPNGNDTFVTDPHPSLDYARYRIVATATNTGAVSYYDIPGIPVEETAVVIQWDEVWSTFDTDNNDELSQPPWSGSLLKLPYNIDVSTNHSADVSLIEYAGRKHPVGYYGTQLGETATWNTEIPKRDKETLYGIRRLAIWSGDVYVREPSGSGYWANVSVSYNVKHCKLTIPVTLSIARVEGGM